MNIIIVDNLLKKYGNLTAVNNISFEVGKGEIFGIVGPNGAGKTTTVECIEGLREYNGGKIELLGMNPAKSNTVFKKKIGVQLQEARLPYHIKVWEALDLYSSLYESSVDWRLLLEKLGLSDKSKTTFKKLSGGQKQRLFIALALVNDPEILFFDELTTGLDPQARLNIWDIVHDIKQQEKLLRGIWMNESIIDLLAPIGILFGLLVIGILISYFTFKWE